MSKIDYLFLGILFRKEMEKIYLENSNYGLQGASNAYQWAIIEGIDSQVEELKIVNALPIGSYPKLYKKLFLKTQYWGKNNIEIGSINLPIIKQITRSIKAYSVVCKWANTTTHDKEIIVYSLYVPYLIALRFAKKRIKNLKVKVIVTDLPGKYGIKKFSWWQRLYEAIFERLFLGKMNFLDGYALLTEHMIVPLNITQTPYTIIEGIVGDNSLTAEPLKRYHEKIVLYTGTLNHQFGILNLVEAFLKNKNPDYKLWICGSGDAEKLIQDAALSDSRITFYGYVTKEEIFRLQNKAKVLINPRQDDDEYTQFSFPSKTMEYLVAQRPVIMYKLRGVPESYNKYLFLVNDNSIDNLAKTIHEVLEMDTIILNDHCAKAKEFVLTYKNSKIQAAKVINL